MERALRERIDPFLTEGNLSLLASRALGREVQAKTASVLTGGCWNRVLAVSTGESELVFKISSDIHNSRIEREYAVLDFFTRNTGMPVPRPLLLDSSGETIPGSLLVMEKIPGTVVHQLHGWLTQPMRNALSDQLGHLVGNLHKQRVEGFGGVELPPEKRCARWADFWLPRFDAVFEEAAGSNLLDGDFLDAVARARESFPRHLSRSVIGTLTHYDIWSGNIMGEISNGSFRVSGLLDIPGFWADYARELSFMEMFGTADARFYEVYRSYHELDEEYKIRKNIYNLKMHLKHVLMYPDQSYYRSGSAQCLSNLQGIS
jgi:fructosamine-3-kinase